MNEPTVHRTEVVVVGGGQAGLATSWHLVRDGVDHVVFEAHTLSHEWADTRWDNFTLVTPNWHCRLPGYEYDGPDPDGFMTRDEVVAWLGGYAETFGPPLREHHAVTDLVPAVGGGYVLTVATPTGTRTWHAQQVVVATGGYHLPITPPWAAALDPSITQLQAGDYRNAAQLPDGAVLVVGSGQSGTQIAEDLHLEGRQVHLALGDAPRVARTYRGRDTMTWLADMGLYETPVASYPGGLAAREKTNHYVTGRDGGGFLLAATGPGGEETWEADHVVIATGGYHVPIVPSWAPALDPSITQLHSADYRNAAQLPEGGVLVVGSGQSGAQIAEDLHLEGRTVHLALGDAPRVARFHRGRDCMTWLAEMGLYDTGVAQYPGGLAAREKSNHYVTGRDGGRDIDLRAFAAEGMRLYGMLEGGAGTELTFLPTMTAALDGADDVDRSICRDIDRYIDAQGIEAPPAAPYTAVWEPDTDPTSLDLAAAGISTVIWAIGYRPDYRWVGAGVFDGTGRPTHSRGVTALPGLYFLGLPWLHTWGSGRFLGIAADAEHVTGVITGRKGGARTEPAADLARRRSPGEIASDVALAG